MARALADPASPLRAIENAALIARRFLRAEGSEFHVEATPSHCTGKTANC